MGITAMVLIVTIGSPADCGLDPKGSGTFLPGGNIAPNGVSGDWVTMLSRAYIFLTIGRQLAKAATTAADHVPDGTPEERSQIAQHVAAIYRILRAATVRRGEIGEFPMLGLGPATPNDSQTQRLELLQNGTRQFRHTFRRYRRHLNEEEREQAMSHIRILAPLVSEIATRTRAERW